MALAIASRFKNAFNVFMHPDRNWRPEGFSYGYRPDKRPISYGNDKSIATVLYNRISMDSASIDLRHVRLDDEGRYLEEIDSELNNCLTLDANIDQTGRDLIQDVVLSMLDEGVVAIVPTDTDTDPEKGGFDVLSLRVGRIVEWYPMHVRVDVYDERYGKHEEIVLPKESTAIVTNPFYSVINQPNSTMKRLIRKLNLLDLLDERIASGKLDIIIQLPYMIKGESRRRQAEMRRRDIEQQLIGSKYGIAYIDASEHITQLNRPAENAFLNQVQSLTDSVYNQFGMSKEILDGTANEITMQNYYSRTVEPIVSAIADEMKRKFLTKTARTQGQSIEFFRDPFKLVPVTTVAEMADKFIRNTILTANEFRQIIGRKPAPDANADQLINPNISQASNQLPAGEEAFDDGVGLSIEDVDEAIAGLDDLDAQLDALEEEIDGKDLTEMKHYASPYYDPKKAHEYYMRTRELKGRSTSSLNDEGKKAARYVKNQLTEERKKKIEEHKIKTDTGINNRNAKMKEDLAVEKETTKEEITEYKDQAQLKIDRLRNTLSAMSKEQKAANKEKINALIAEVRADNTAQREKLNAAYKELNTKTRASVREQNTSDREAHKTEKARLTAEYNEKYYAELDKMLADKNFKKVSKKKK